MERRDPVKPTRGLVAAVLVLVLLAVAGVTVACEDLQKEVATAEPASTTIMMPTSTTTTAPASTTAAPAFATTTTEGPTTTMESTVAVPSTEGQEEAGGAGDEGADDDAPGETTTTTPVVTLLFQAYPLTTTTTARVPVDWAWGLSDDRAVKGVHVGDRIHIELDFRVAQEIVGVAWNNNDTEVLLGRGFGVERGAGDFVTEAYRDFEVIGSGTATVRARFIYDDGTDIIAWAITVISND
jgi:hypothetical protein